MPTQSLYLKCAKFSDLYDTKLLIFYHKLLNNNISTNYLNFKPTISNQMKNPQFAQLNIYFLHITMNILNYLADTNYPYY